MIKVIEIIDGTNYGGITRIMYDISQNAEDIDMHFLTQIPIYDNVGNSYNLNANRNTIFGKFKYNYRLYKFLKKNKYDIIHINSAAFFFSFQVLIISKISGIRKSVVHSHNNLNLNYFKRLIVKILNPIYRKISDVHLTCSKESAHSLFTKVDDVILLKNGIYIEKYKFNKTIRKQYRKELNIEGKKVYGHVGRFSREKNHLFLIDIFYNIQRYEEDAVLLLVGKGDKLNLILDKVKELQIEDKVFFLGFRKDINNLLNAMDIFIFPSIHEGLPIVIVEALASGLPVVVSKNITEDLNVSNNYFKVNSFELDDWKNTIKNIKTSNRVYAYKDMLKNGYDIREVSKQLEKIYKDLIR